MCVAYFKGEQRNVTNVLVCEVGNIFEWFTTHYHAVSADSIYVQAGYFVVIE